MYTEIILNFAKQIHHFLVWFLYDSIRLHFFFIPSDLSITIIKFKYHNSRETKFLDENLMHTISSLDFLLEYKLAKKKGECFNQKV